MRIALAVDTLDAARGGAERGIAALGRALSDRGHAVTLVCARTSAPDPRWTVRTLKRPRLLKFRRVRGFALAASRILPEYEASVSFGDIPGAGVYLPHGGVWASWRKQEIASSETRAEAKARAQAIDRSPRQRAARELEEATLRHPGLKGVIALSHMVRDNLKYTAGYEGPVAVIPNGIVLPGPAPRQRRPGPPRLLFAAHNFRLKGLANFVRIVARLKDTEGIIAGRGGPLLYRRLARKLGCAGRLRFLGGDASMEALYSEADVLVQPTFYDPCSLTTLEALARGIPVVTSRLNGAGELIRLTGAGAVVSDPRNDAAFAEAVERVLAHPDPDAALRTAGSVAEPGQTLKAVQQIEAWHGIMRAP